MPPRVCAARIISNAVGCAGSFSRMAKCSINVARWPVASCRKMSYSVGALSPAGAVSVDVGAASAALSAASSSKFTSVSNASSDVDASTATGSRASGSGSFGVVAGSSAAVLGVSAGARSGKSSSKSSRPVRLISSVSFAAAAGDSSVVSSGVSSAGRLSLAASCGGAALSAAGGV